LNLKSSSILALLILITLILFSVYRTEPEIQNRIDKIRGINAFNNQEYELAIKYLLADLNDNPNDDELHYLVGKSFMMGPYKNLNSAIKHYNIFLSLVTDTDKINAEMVYSIRAIGLHESLNNVLGKINNDYLKALIIMNSDELKAYKLLQKIPLDRWKKEYYELLTQLAFSLEKYDEAIVASDKAMALGSLNKNLYYQRSQALLRNERYEEAQAAIEIFELIEQLKGSLPQIEKINLLKDFIDKEKNAVINLSLSIKLIELLIETNKSNQAFEMLKSIEIGLLDSMQKINLLIQSNKANNNDIFEYISTTIDTSLNNLDYLTTICEYYSKNNNESAIDFCLDAVQHYPTSAPLNFWYSIALLKNNELSNAIKFMNHAVEYAPWINIWRIQLAKLYLTNGNYELAVRIINQAIIQDSTISDFKIMNGLE
jgi:Flp pilus assembly protein TadD